MYFWISLSILKKREDVEFKICGCTNEEFYKMSKNILKI